MLADEVTAEENYKFDASAQARLFRVALLRVGGARQFKEMDIDTESDEVVAIIRCSDLPETIRRRGVTIVRGAQDIDSPERFGPIQIPSGDPQNLWVVVVQASGQFELKTVEAPDKASAIAKLGEPAGPEKAVVR